MISATAVQAAWKSFSRHCSLYTTDVQSLFITGVVEDKDADWESNNVDKLFSILGALVEY